MSEIIETLKQVGAIITNTHVVLTSGRHSNAYINKDALYPHTLQASKIGRMFADKFKNEDIDVVVAPAVGGTILSQWTAYFLSELKHREVLGLYTEKDKGTTASAIESDQILRRGYDAYVKGKKVLVIEDLTTTGISVKKVVQAVKAAGGEVIAVSAMVNRDPKNVTSTVVGGPFYPLSEFSIESYDEDDCPLCKNGVPVNTTVGHGKEFVQQQISKNKLK